ncbi:hypothetical protein [Ktedonospora formicarum]|uniref:hypothetical protein n=1 Tax=Ktedonospora formicarum TaxID=2778364 RepID=UPI001C689A5F|nr:hypothetical protein [Ktedonospora formicarum]
MQEDRVGPLRGHRLEEVPDPVEVVAPDQRDQSGPLGVGQGVRRLAHDEHLP